MALRVVLRHGHTGCCGTREGNGAGNLRDDGNLLALKVLHELTVECAVGIEVVDDDIRFCASAGLTHDIERSQRRLHVARARKHGHEDEIRRAAPIVHTAHEHARRIDNLKIALLRKIRVIADLMDGTALRVGGDERHGLAATLKRKGKLVRDGGLADSALLVEHQNRVHVRSPFCPV